MKIGQTDSEKKSKSLQKCRQIVAEINNFGVNDFERVQIIHLLSLELEDRDLITDFAEVIKGYRGDIFETKQENDTLLQ
jgi:hypothetical protein